MGLDAFVYCNCFETGRLRKPPKPEWNVRVAEDGDLECARGPLEQLMAFDTWRSFEACEHKDGMAVHKRIGNIALVVFLRKNLEAEASRFPTTLGKVLYNGTHAGDFLNLNQVSAVRQELPALSEMHCDDPKDEDFLREFEAQIRELVEVALKMQKPIVF